VLLETWPQISKMLASTVQFSRYGRVRLLPVPTSSSEAVLLDPAVRPAGLPAWGRACARSLRTQQCALRRWSCVLRSSPEGRTESAGCRRRHVDVPSVSSRRFSFGSDASSWTIRRSPSAP